MLNDSIHKGIDEGLVEKYMKSMKLSDNPCRGCTTETGRCTNCHSTCEKGIAHERLMRADKERKDKCKKQFYSSFRNSSGMLTNT